MKKEHNFYAIAMAILGSEMKITCPPGHKRVRAPWPDRGWTFVPMTEGENEFDEEACSDVLPVSDSRAGGEG